MNKLPIFSVLGRAIGFVIGNLLTIIRLSWFPLLLLFAASYFLQKYLMENMATVMSGAGSNDIDRFATGFSKVSNIMALSWGFALLQLAITAMIAVALHRIILFGERRPGTLILFSFGWVEVLYVLMFIFYYVVIFVIFISIVFGAAAILGNSKDAATQIFSMMPKSGDPTGMYTFIAIGLVILIPIVWFICRTYVLPPAIVATGNFALREVWTLTKNNVWRIIALNVLAVLFLITLVYAILKFVPYDMVPPQWHMEFYTTGATPIGTNTMQMLQMQQENWILYTAINYVAAIVFGAFGVGLMSHSYKALKSGDGEPAQAVESMA